MRNHLSGQADKEHYNQDIYARMISNGMKLIPQNSLEAKSWDTALLGRPDAHFLQSWAWGEFHSQLGHKIWRLAVEDENDIINQLLVIKMPLPLGQSFLYSPRGNLVNKKLSAQKQQQSTKLLIDKIKEVDEQERAILFRIDPGVFVNDSVTASVYRTLAFKRSYKNIQPKHSLILNLSPSEDTLLNRMKSKTRYNIKLAAKHEVEVKRADSLDQIVVLTDLIRETAQRDKFKPHPLRYYKTQFEVLHPAGIQDLFIAYYQEEPIAAILINTFGSTATYVHGASSYEHRNLMAPYLLQFAAILTSKDKGITTYDFWGYHPSPNHPWAGISRFKQGFNPQPVQYIGTLELPLRPFLYKLYTWINRLKN